MKTVLIKDSEAKLRGFFSSMNLLLQTIYICNKNSLVPHFDDSVFSLYSDKKSKKLNFFENEYFTKKEKYDETFELNAVHGKLNIKDIKILQEINSINNYMISSLKKDVKDYVNNYPSEYKSDTKYALHYRGTDYLKNTFYGHIQNLNSEVYLNYIKSKDCNIFVATDDSYFIEKAKLKGLSISYFKDVARGAPGNAVHLVKRIRIFEKYSQEEKAKQVLRDALWLSKCDFFVGSQCNMSTYNKFANLKQKQEIINE